MNKDIQGLIEMLNKQFVGFDRHYQILSNRPTYPPYNIIKNLVGDVYIIEIAVAGIDRSKINIIVENNNLVVEYKKPPEEISPLTYFHKGIASRDFKLEFPLTDTYLKVKTATMSNGILSMVLEKDIPEEMKPKHITIEHKE